MNRAKDISICILPVGLRETVFLSVLKTELEGIFQCGVQVLEPVSIWNGAYNNVRGQYNSTALLHYISVVVSSDCRLLAVTDEDLYSDELNFVFGEADLVRKNCIVSIKRLRNVFYGQSEDCELFMERLLKESVHELGHTFGLRHCSNPSCVMYFSNSILDTDRKGKTFCDRCKERVRG